MNQALLPSKDRPRVLHVVLALNPGGAERTVVELVRRSEGTVTNAVCCLDAEGEWAGQVRACGVPVIVLGRRSGFHPTLGWRLARVAASQRSDVLHCHQYSPFVYSRIAQLCKPGLRFVFTEQGRLSDAPPSVKRRMVNRLLGSLPGRICAVSEDLRNYMIAEGFPPGRVEVIPNAVDPGARPDASARLNARKGLGIQDGAFVVGTAARLDPVKSLETLVEAFAEARRELTTAVLVIIGDGPERRRLESLADEKGVSGAVLFTGMRGDVRALLPALDVYVNCSVSEGTSLTIMEAMAAALPVIATDVGGNPEVVASGVTGILVPPRAPSALSRLFVSLEGDPARRDALGQAGRRRMEANFSFDRVVERYVRIYRNDNQG